MTTYFARGASTDVLTERDLRHALHGVLTELEPRRRVLAVPPDQTRSNSRAGLLTCLAHDYLGERLVDVMPALGTHHAMNETAVAEMFPGLPFSLIRHHDWQRDVVTIGQVPAEFVRSATEGIYDQPWPAQVNRLLWSGGHDLILSIGQVVPHEVIGMANYNKNIFVGTGGAAGINESHYLSAVYGMERMMGHADTPLRRILNYAEREFCGRLPLLYVLTVVGNDESGKSVTRGLFIGDDVECFELASRLSIEVNVEQFDRPIEKIVCYLDPREFSSTWLGNKAIYRTRMALADAGELVVLGPGIREFGEQRTIDRLIYKYGYRTTDQVLRLVAENEDLRCHLSAAAHLIHGSPEDRFRVVYCPGHLTETDIRSVGYQYGDLTAGLERYPPHRPNGWYKTTAGESYYYINNPALGLWAWRERLHVGTG